MCFNHEFAPAKQAMLQVTLPRELQSSPERTNSQPALANQESPMTAISVCSHFSNIFDSSPDSSGILSNSSVLSQLKMQWSKFARPMPKTTKCCLLRGPNECSHTEERVGLGTRPSGKSPAAWDRRLWWRDRSKRRAWISPETPKHGSSLEGCGRWGTQRALGVPC